MTDWGELLKETSVIPVLVIDRIEDAVPLASTLVDAGLRVLEITLRTPASREAIQEILNGVPQAVIGAGTVLDADQLNEMAELGVRFAVSPGHTPALLDAARETGLPFLPGAQTLAEILFVREHGFYFQKFFPAGLNGGTAMLKSISTVVQDVNFCPTGGVSPDNAHAYLSLPNVACVGGSWIAPRDLIMAGRWDEIFSLAKAARLLNPGNP
ncbi:bifunctional 4-hydroxy-2-oxoglutarate aldolase/2-dehydro-3-deoxy-phosphogluconate aldolase [Sedimenticola hydrogenitrophicus]|uniref:bifunctional 4-hydroxy-2-oxoglutarate aldolase/2-dehydro-3-deoxy-phosphogluconate aldolase n=1 Tax=Sedimenticola hydrogenitrophicus TaxID=2967975 RepID=UPI0023AE9E3F|nr:bifunctional 4-hydroxy-2-oxoglutarate aldolase/2-dehydro-3-deoxy-phosphogluconate aldolase [Sedimenticola hydrogenitrophicus]